MSTGTHNWVTFPQQVALTYIGDMGMDRDYFLQVRYDGKPINLKSTAKTLLRHAWPTARKLRFLPSSRPEKAKWKLTDTSETWTSFIFTRITLPANKAAPGTKATTNRMSSSTTVYFPTTATSLHTVTDVTCWTDTPYAKTLQSRLQPKAPAGYERLPSYLILGPEREIRCRRKGHRQFV